jgi:hypothetical protein
MEHVLLIALHILLILGLAFFTGQLFVTLFRLFDGQFGGARLTHYRYEVLRRRGFTAIVAIVVLVLLYFFVPF